MIDEHTRIVDALEQRRAADGTVEIRAHARRVSEYGPRLQQQHPDYFEQ
jgi:DNA-binding GntR family transcriptional regulator